MYWDYSLDSVLRSAPKPFLSPVSHPIVRIVLKIDEVTHPMTTCQIENILNIHRQQLD